MTLQKLLSPCRPQTYNFTERLQPRTTCPTLTAGEAEGGPRSPAQEAGRSTLGPRLASRAVALLKLLCHTNVSVLRCLPGCDSSGRLHTKKEKESFELGTPELLPHGVPPEEDHKASALDQPALSWGGGVRKTLNFLNKPKVKQRQNMQLSAYPVSRLGCESVTS